jgi:hypothetical protein
VPGSVRFWGKADAGNHAVSRRSPTIGAAEVTPNCFIVWDANGKALCQAPQVEIP